MKIIREKYIESLFTEKLKSYKELTETVKRIHKIISEILEKNDLDVDENAESPSLQHLAGSNIDCSSIESVAECMGEGLDALLRAMKDIERLLETIKSAFDEINDKPDISPLSYEQIQQILSAKIIRVPVGHTVETGGFPKVCYRDMKLSIIDVIVILSTDFAQIENYTRNTFYGLRDKEFPYPPDAKEPREPF